MQSNTAASALPPEGLSAASAALGNSVAGNLSGGAVFIQLLLTAASFAAAIFLYRLVKGRVKDAIGRARMPIRIRRVVDNLSGLIVPACALALIFVSTALLGDVIGPRPFLAGAAMKLLVAWIIIRVALQFVTNTLIRNALIVSILAVAALSVFGILDETAAALDAVGFSFGKVRFSALALIKAVMSVCILLYLALFASTFLERRVLQSRSLTRSSQVMVIKILRLSLAAFAVLVGISGAGVDLSIFAVFCGAVGLGVGFGLQKVVSNLFSGMLLLADKSIRPGDIIELEKSGTYGWINHIAARYTEIVTRDNKSFLIPNEDFITQRVVNWSHGSKQIRLDIKFGVDCKSDPHEVIKIAIEAAKTPRRVADTPAPVCWLTEFGEKTLNFSLQFWITDAEQGLTNIKGEVLLALWDAFRKHGIHTPGTAR